MQSVILGTAQWGLDYGVTNTRGRMADDALADLTREALRSGIARLDTAPDYGDAEERIGQVAVGFGIQTKVSAAGLSASDIADSIRRSLVRTGTGRLAAVLVHDWHDLDEEGRRIAAGALARAREAGIVGAIGVSAYGVVDLDTAASVFDRLDIVQVPVNVLDQRLDHSRAVDWIRSRGTLVQARSVLLQGVALSLDDRSPFGTHPDVRRLRDARALAGLEPSELCLGYVRSRRWVDEVVVASTSAEELKSLMKYWASPPAQFDWHSIASVDVDLIDPRRWDRYR